MRRLYLYISLAAAICFTDKAASQNLAPTVEVSKAYEAKIAEINKPSREMIIPDSVRTFRLDFDYSVFEKPYKGAYDFNPYVMSMRPSAVDYDPQFLYLKVGAGYRLYPELDFIWSPTFKNGFSMDVYATHKSYVGDYRNIGMVEKTQGVFDLNCLGKERWKGYDLMSNAGTILRYSWLNGVLGFNVDYFGLAGKSHEGKRGYDALDLNFSIASNKDENRNFLYDFSVDYRFGEDKMNYNGMSYLTEHLASLNLSLAPVFKHGHKIIFDLGASASVYRSAVDGGAFKLHFVPKYIYRRGRLSIDAGVALDMVLTSSSFSPFFKMDNQQYVYPDVSVSYALIKNAMSVYAAVEGGTKLNTYSSLIEDDHYLNLTYSSTSYPLFGADIERVRGTFGIRGRVTTKFSYNLRGGYSLYENALLPALSLVGDVPAPAVGYSGYQRAFAALDWRLEVEPFRFDGSISYNHSWGFNGSDWTFAPAKVTGNAAVEYNWRRRIFVGVECDFATDRVAAVIPESDIKAMRIPGYADLRVSVEYAMSRKLSFWLRGGNLCCMTIQRTPLYAEGGINFTAGICLNL